MKRRIFATGLIALLFFLSFGGGALLKAAPAPITLYTPYTSLSVTPGESVSYSIQVVNNTDAIQTVRFTMKPPANWDYEATAGGYKVDEISVMPKDQQTLSLQVNVPLQISKGTYRFLVDTNQGASLPLAITVTEEGTYKTELTADQPNMEGNSKSTFQYELTLRNRTADEQLYALTATAPEGWNTTFSVDGKDVTSVSVAAGSTKSISVQLDPPDQVKAGSYKIPVKATTKSTSASLELEAVVTGTFDMKLSTPSGLLSTDITAGGTRSLTLQVTNSGSAPLKNITFQPDTPINWEVTFSPEKIDQLAAGESKEVTATIKADKKAIAGDYAVSITAQAPEISSRADFRVAVKTSLLWGWVGIFLILLILAGLYWVIRKYGRR
ncbi:NEW3 domain-containing protein [Thermicanus aegyptius]|uniref:COG1470 family protein n=1 Tax=Thermicanus aegyptius TaxID=94009 RepID=UPI00041B0221|nr:NEW3 domain-containing protein [Thermicanus aegyptius]